MTNEDLIKLAMEARENAYVPISKFKVGAALITSSGKIFSGCNIEDISGIGVTNCCAERTAIIKAISEGELKFEKIAVVGGHINDELIHCTPCGVCRQYMNSFSQNIEVICHSNKGTFTYLLKELLPEAFNEEF